MGPAEAPVAEVAEFLNVLRTVEHKGIPLAPSTIAGYKSAVAAIHKGFRDGTTVSSNTDLSTLIKGLFVVSARPRTLSETWDLPTVLKYLAGPPFEPFLYGTIEVGGGQNSFPRTTGLGQAGKLGPFLQDRRMSSAVGKWRSSPSPIPPIGQKPVGLVHS